MKVLLVEPYYSGSHKYWADNFIERSSHEVKIHTMPGRHWKWRMKGSAIYLADLLKKDPFVPDLILCSSMMDVAMYKALIFKKGFSPPVFLYMHENQLTYPFSTMDSRKHEDFHYGFINIGSCIASDKIIFNSRYHRNVFLEAVENLRKRLPDFNQSYLFDLEQKTTVIYVGIHMEKMKNLELRENRYHPTLLWNHRWDEDKNPQLFARLCQHLKFNGIDFKMILLGDHGTKVNNTYEEININYNQHIIHSGYASEALYMDLLKQATLLPVTSDHDFYGISVLEAIYCGAVSYTHLTLPTTPYV